MENLQDLQATEFYNSSDLYFNICENRNEKSFRNVLDVIKQYNHQKAKLMEFGCGTGNLAGMVGKMGFKVTGVDISTRFIDYATEKYKAGNPNLDFKVVGFGRLPFEDNSFDCIYTSAVLEHCYDVDQIVKDFDRLLKPSGILILGTPNILSPFTRFSLMLQKLMGKRKRFHLYGSPSFLLKSIRYTLQKQLASSGKPIYVKPDYDNFNESDEDVTFLSNHYDFLAMLKPLNYKIYELSRGDSKGGKMVAKLFPKLSGEVLIVARKLS